LLADLVGLEAMRNRRLDDRRRRPRLDHDADVIIAPDEPTNPPIDAQVRDMSAEGISLDVAMPLALNLRFFATMTRVSGEGIVSLTYAVRRCERQPDGRYLVGGELIEYRAASPFIVPPPEV
jgi:hypothetical protein